MVDMRRELVFFGAGPDTGNCGVSALFATMIAGLSRRLDPSRLTVFDYGRRRSAKYRLDEGEPFSIHFEGLRRGSRIWMSENLTNLRLCGRLPGPGSWVNPGIRAIRNASAVFDVSGGDSFTDMYPDDRIETMAGCKELVLSIGAPLILLPQTFGPFDKSRARAASIVQRSAACWARDERSFEVLKSLLGPAFNPEVHRCGVDMAFGLAAIPPRDAVADEFEDWLQQHVTRIGLNVSGLMYNNPAKTREKYGFRADYREILDRFLEWVLGNTDVGVCLIPHVMSPPPVEESDVMACSAIASRWAGYGSRMIVSPTDINQSEVKWFISRMNWFCGTRMHATIAGLSTCTPTATVSYSDKALGVFESCGQGGEVFDPRVLDTDAVVAGMISSFQRREELLASLKENMPSVKRQAEAQMDEIAAVVHRYDEQRRQAG